MDKKWAQKLLDCELFFSSELFHEVQMQRIFDDSKTFADAIPYESFAAAIQAYELEKDTIHFDLKHFALKHFYFPQPPQLKLKEYYGEVESYIQHLWTRLKREPDDFLGDTLLPLNNAYLVPGGRFREIYYWDSYFSALGLIIDGHESLVKDMLENLIYLQKQLGFIPNGNRAYYSSRSQPPVLALIVGLLLGEKAEKHAEYEQHFGDTCLHALETEYLFWMTDKQFLSENKTSSKRVVRMPDGSILNRFWDNDNRPRPESYFEDVHATQHLNRYQTSAYFRNVRAACESGWDFTSRWMGEKSELEHIRTTDFIPVDLNALLFKLEMQLADYYVAFNHHDKAKQYRELAEKRKAAMSKYLWCEQKQWYFDWDHKHAKRSEVESLATAVPLYIEMVGQTRAKQIADKIENDFLKKGGLVTTQESSKQQWDSPNGWAPLHYFSVLGLKKYGYCELANEIMKRWNNNIEYYFSRHGTLMEKYDVIDMNHKAEGGEYSVQVGFGWTNGVTRLFKILD